MKKLSKIQSYLVGLLQSDGHFNGKYFSIELSAKDSDIIYKLHSSMKDSSIYYRTRDTNFVKNYKSIILNFYNKKLIKKLGPFIPIGKKSSLITCPKEIIYSEYDYWRGMVDGDGSLGIKEKTGQPFISINTASDFLLQDFNQFLHKEINFKLNIKRNKRDNTYNMVLLMAKSILIVRKLYENNILAIDRKNIKANSIISFDLKRFNSKENPFPFSEEDDLLIINNSQSQSIKLIPNHHPTSISSRRRFLRSIRKYGFI